MVSVSVAPYSPPSPLTSMESMYEHTYTFEEMLEYGHRLHLNTLINSLINGVAAFVVLRYSTKAMGIYKFYILLTIFCAFCMDFHITFVFGPYIMLPAPIMCGAGFVSVRSGLFWGNHLQYVSFKEEQHSSNVFYKLGGRRAR